MIHRKPMLSVSEQIEHMKLKGITFNLLSEEEATLFLRDNNNYFKLRSYRKNFAEYVGGENDGKYINLDFAMLKNLSVIDMNMRYTFIQLILDIEHFAKINLLNTIERRVGDGYDLVEGYFDYLKMSDDKNPDFRSRHATMMSMLNKNNNNTYCGGIIQTYANSFPVWAFIEVISLGTFIDFYGFCMDEMNEKKLKNNYFLLLTIKELRNATAHNNCLIVDLGIQDSKHRIHNEVNRALQGISRDIRKNHLKNERLRQIITLLYTHNKLVTSIGVHRHTKEKLNQLVDKMFGNIEYYNKNDKIYGSFTFIKKVIDLFYNS